MDELFLLGLVVTFVSEFRFLFFPVAYLIGRELFRRNRVDAQILNGENNAND